MTARRHHRVRPHPGRRVGPGRASTRRVLAPGSRSTPLALALAADARHPAGGLPRRALGRVLRPRRGQGVGPAGGRALHVGDGRRQLPPGGAGGLPRPGAAGRLHRRPPARAARHRRRPGHRPDQALRRRGALVRRGRVPPTDRPGAAAYWRSVAARSVAEASGPAGRARPPQPGRSGSRWCRRARRSSTPPGRPDGAAVGGVAAGPAVRPTPADVDRLAGAVRGRRRGAWSWPAGGPTSAPRAVERVRRRRRLAGARRPAVAACARARTRCRPTTPSCGSPGFAGRAPARPRRSASARRSPGKVATAWLDAASAQVAGRPRRRLARSRRGAAERVVADPDAAPRRGRRTRSVARPASRSVARRLAGRPRPRPGARSTTCSTPGTSRSRAGWPATSSPACPTGATLVVGSSMPVRDVESFARPRDGAAVPRQPGRQRHRRVRVDRARRRGRRDDGPVVALVRRPHASSTTPAGCSARPARGIDATFVVLDNDGGGIFSFLPQAGLPEHFETLFGTPHGLDLVALVAVHGIAVERVEKADDAGAGGRRRRSRAAACGSWSSPPTGPPTSPATARPGPRSPRRCASRRCARGRRGGRGPLRGGRRRGGRRRARPPSGRRARDRRAGCGGRRGA